MIAHSKSFKSKSTLIRISTKGKNEIGPWMYKSESSTHAHLVFLKES
mgnify:CR=1 FL=1